MNLKTIENPIYFCLALQNLSLKQGIALIPTYLNTKTVDKQGFNPNFLIFKACADGTTVVTAYVILRTRRLSEPSSYGFSSVMVVDKARFDLSMHLYKKHVSEFPDTDDGIVAFCKEIIDSIKTTMV